MLFSVVGFRIPVVVDFPHPNLNFLPLGNSHPNGGGVVSSCPTAFFLFFFYFFYFFSIFSKMRTFCHPFLASFLPLPFKRL